MNLTIENFLLVGSILLFISIIVGKTSYKFGVPTLLLFLGIGMLAGSEGLAGIHFDNPKMARFIGVVSLNFILFSGGLDTRWSSVRPILKEGIVLSTVGVLLTAITMGVFVAWVSPLTLYEGLLLGAIVSSTDAAAVFSILRSKNLALRKNLRPILEFESGSNDPMAYVLTIAFLSLVLNPELSLISIVPFFFKQMLIGTIGGFFFGKLSKIIINKIKLDFEGLYPILVIALMFITYSATDFIGGNGFLAIYIAAVYLGNQDIIHKKSILKMYDGLAWLMQIVLFLSLGLLVFPSQVLPLAGLGLLLSFFLILVARPLSIFLGLVFFKMRFKHRAYIAWVGLRGAVPIVFATYPLLAGIQNANMIFNLVFFISVISVLVQGTTLSTVAKWLQVSIPEKLKPISDTERFLQEFPKSALREFTLNPGDRANGKQIVNLHFPLNAFIVMIKRNNQFIRPGGSTALQEKDTLMVIADKPEDFEQVKRCLHATEPQEVIT